MKVVFAVLALVLGISQSSFGEGAASEARAINEARKEAKGKELFPLEGVETFVFRTDTSPWDYLIEVELGATSLKGTKKTSGSESLIAVGINNTSASLSPTTLQRHVGRLFSLVNGASADRVEYSLTIKVNEIQSIGPSRLLGKQTLPLASLIEKLTAKGEFHLEEVEKLTQGKSVVVELKK